MISTPDPWWPTALLALVLLSDAAMSVRPPVFIQQCLEGVRFPATGGGCWW